MSHLPHMMVHQDYAHHIQSEPIEQLGAHVIFPWPVAVPEGWDRVSTPLLTEARLAALRERCSCPNAPEVPAVVQRPIPDPVPDVDPFAEEPN
jgi:hypothetical protein